MKFKPYQRAVIIYVVVAALWIYLSDTLVAANFSTVQDIQSAQIYKGWLYVLATGAILYVVIKRDFDIIEVSGTRLLKSYEETLRGWIDVLDLRDKETKDHTTRVTKVATELARLAGMDGEDLKKFERGAMLHDIGKMGIPDAILTKPEKLNKEEYEVIKRHPDIAYDLLNHIDFLKNFIDIPYCHHEKWDGSGYPRGLKGDEIPFSARLFAIIDVWDALSRDRIYKKAWSEEEICTLFKNESGRHFDPFVVDLFFTHYARLMEVAQNKELGSIRI
ncbi:MAG: HD domain-containing protein [Burkholderiales bacterium]|nr:HD domain-containing protein [Burkholderiales bacterium]